MASTWRSISLLLWKNYRIKQRESSLNRNESTKRWLFPALVLDIIMPLCFLLLIIQKLCQYNTQLMQPEDTFLNINGMSSGEFDATMQKLMEALVLETGGSSDSSDSTDTSVPIHKLNKESATLLLTVLPLLLVKSNQSLAILDRPDSNLFLQYLDRHYPGSSELGIPSYFETTKIIPLDNIATSSFISQEKADEILSEYPKQSGTHIYAGFDLRNSRRNFHPISEFVALFYRKQRTDISEDTGESQLSRYFSKTLTFNQTMFFPNILPFQMAMNQFIRENLTQGSSSQGRNSPTPMRINVTSYPPNTLCASVHKMLISANLPWSIFPETSPLGQSWAACRTAITNGHLSPDVWTFLSNLVTKLASNDELSTLSVATLPNRPTDKINGLLTGNIAFYVGYLFMWPYIRLVRDIVNEKESQLKEYLMIMGLQATSLLISWFLLYFFALVVIAVIGTWLLSGSMFAATAVGNVYFFLLVLMFSSSMLLFGIAITPIFNQTKTASACAPLVYFIFSVGSFIRSFLRPDMIMSSPLLGSLLKVLDGIGSPVVFISTIRNILAFDPATSLNKPITWDTVATPYRLMAGQCVVYLLVGWYLENVFPRTYGVQQKWYFVFQPSYWFPRQFDSQSFTDDNEDSERVGLTKMDLDSIDERTDSTLRESSLTEYLQSFQPSLFVKSLSKTYPNGKVALNNVSFGVRKGEIFGLLGPNGAGKSTTMSILSGMLLPTSGDAYMGGSISVANNPQAVRQSLSVCFQQNILFGNLTVWEHLSLVCALKNSLGIKTVSEDVCRSRLEQFRLDEKCDALVKTLSGGQKRKLSLILALLDSSRVLLLDEPTAGMDQKARLDTWDALKHAVTHRAVILTTHSMEEAQALCENIGIVAEGSLKCCGSSLFLQNRYGVGYKLTVVRCEEGGQGDDHSNVPPLDQAWSDRLMKTVKKYIPNATILSDNKWETRVQLNDGEERRFAELFKELEMMKQAGTVKRYAIAATNLEDVFVKVTEGEGVYYHVKDDAENDDTNESVDPVLSEGKTKKSNMETDSQPADTDEELPMWKVSILQLRALIVKRAKMSSRDKKSLFAQYVWPLGFFTIFLTMAQNVISMNENIEVVTTLPPFARTASLYVASAPAVTDSVANVVAQIKQDFNPVVFDKNAQTEQAMLAAIARERDTAFFAGIFVSHVNWTSELTVSSPAFAYSLYYNETVPYSLPVSLQRMSQAYCRARSKHVNAPGIDNCDLIVKRGIFPVEVEIGTGLSTDEDGLELDPDEAVSIVQRVMLVFYLLMTISSMVGFYAGPVVRERACGLKRMQYQHLGTINASWLYWLSNFLFDYMTYIVAITFIITALAVFSALTNNAILAAWLVTMSLYGLAMLPSQYFSSLVFASHTSAQSYMSYASLFQIMAISIVFALSMIPGLCGKAYTVAYFLQIMPFYTFGISMLNIVTVSWAPARQQCLAMGSDIRSENLLALVNGLANSEHESSVWDWEVAGSSWFTLVASAVIYTLLLLAIDQYEMYPAEVHYKVHRKLQHLRRYFCWRRYVQGYAEADQSTFPSDEEDPNMDMVHARRVTKVYNPLKDTILRAYNETAADEVANGLVNRKGQVVALNDVTFSVERRDCVALLGVNGSGKSTMFEILTARVFPTLGTATIDAFDVSVEARDASTRYGYCPQGNMFYNDLTVREHLELFYRLRCRTSNALLSEGAVIDELIRRLNLFPVEETAALHLSGGNRRRLMLALALLSDHTSLLLLDEPSAGVDVVARRLMWRILHEKRQNSTQMSCLFTTHSMEEAEAVCANAVVLLKGKVVWSGSIPELKQRVSRGVSISVRLDSSAIWNSDEMKFYTEQIRCSLKSKPLMVAGGTELERRDLLLQELDEAWKLCHGLLYKNGDATALAVSRQRSKTWLAGLRARFSDDSSRDRNVTSKFGSSAKVLPVVPIVEFVQQWLVQEAFVRLETEFFKNEITTQSGKVVVPAHVETACGSGTNTSGVYETSCTDNFGLADAFALMEKNKKRFNIAQYSISELSLERVFEQFQ
ncbi:unnamed protein product [Peronospora belbahrii]|uniref:ABC transporter domain-containing protein n=1 Tax=Peronospora belbahrii TaxID=622444 RepID=A0AAU9KMM6_9STRA|nr:unnamed protein product [Peronospora belbahrii]